MDKILGFFYEASSMLQNPVCINASTDRVVTCNTVQAQHTSSDQQMAFGVEADPALLQGHLRSYLRSELELISASIESTTFA